MTVIAIRSLVVMVTGISSRKLCEISINKFYFRIIYWWKLNRTSLVLVFDVAYIKCSNYCYLCCCTLLWQFLFEWRTFIPSIVQGISWFLLRDLCWYVDDANSIQS